MFPDPMMDVALFELEERIRTGDKGRYARECGRSRTMAPGRFRWVVGILLLRLGNAMLGDGAWLRSDVPGAG